MLKNIHVAAIMYNSFLIISNPEIKFGRYMLQTFIIPANIRKLT